MSQIITRLFDRFSDAEHAVVELERVGVPAHDISLVSLRTNAKHHGVRVREPHDATAGEAAARDAGVGAAVGGVVGAAGGVLAGLGMVAIPGLGPVIAAGWLVSAAAAAAAGAVAVGAAGGLVGALANAGVSQQEADVYAEAVRRGATLVSAKVQNAIVDAATIAVAAVPSVDVNARAAEYRRGGWDHFDEAAPPYTDAEVEDELTRWRVL